MAIFDKLNDFAKNATEKTNTAIEISKLSAKSEGEKRNLDAIVKKIGEYFVAKMDAGEVIDEESTAMYQGVFESRKTIAELKAEIEALKAPKEEPAAAKKFCSSCGKEVDPAAKFCVNCGTSLQ